MGTVISSAALLVRGCQESSAVLYYGKTITLPPRPEAGTLVSRLSRGRDERSSRLRRWLWFNPYALGAQAAPAPSFTPKSGRPSGRGSHRSLWRLPARMPTFPRTCVNPIV